MIGFNRDLEEETAMDWSAWMSDVVPYFVRMALLFAAIGVAGSLVALAWWGLRL